MYLIHDAKGPPTPPARLPPGRGARRLQGQRLLVLGIKAQSTAAICQHCLSGGARMAVVDTLVDVAADFVGSAAAGQAVALSGDMRDETLLAAAVARAEVFMQGIDGLCFFGGQSVAPSPKRLNALRLPLDTIARHGGGSVVLLREGAHDQEDLRGLLDALLSQHEGQGLRINAVVVEPASGATNGPNAGSNSGPLTLPIAGAQTGAHAPPPASVVKMDPSQAEAAAALTQFLLSQEARAINGQFFHLQAQG